MVGFIESSLPIAEGDLDAQRIAERRGRASSKLNRPGSLTLQQDADAAHSEPIRGHVAKGVVVREAEAGELRRSGDVRLERPRDRLNRATHGHTTRATVEVTQIPLAIGCQV